MNVRTKTSIRITIELDQGETFSPWAEVFQVDRVSFTLTNEGVTEPRLSGCTRGKQISETVLWKDLPEQIWEEANAAIKVQKRLIDAQLED